MKLCLKAAGMELSEAITITANIERLATRGFGCAIPQEVAGVRNMLPGDRGGARDRLPRLLCEDARRHRRYRSSLVDDRGGDQVQPGGTVLSGSRGGGRLRCHSGPSRNRPPTSCRSTAARTDPSDPNTSRKFASFCSTAEGRRPNTRPRISR